MIPLRCPELFLDPYSLKAANVLNLLSLLQSKNKKIERYRPLRRKNMLYYIIGTGAELGALNALST